MSAGEGEGTNAWSRRGLVGKRRRRPRDWATLYTQSHDGRRARLVAVVPRGMLTWRRAACLATAKQGSHRPQTPPPPRLATWEVTLNARKVVHTASVGLRLVLVRTVYSQAQGCVCTVLQLGGDVEQPWPMSKYGVIHKTGST